MEKDHEKTGKVQEKTSSAQKIDSAQKTGASFRTEVLRELNRYENQWYKRNNSEVCDTSARAEAAR